MRVGILGGGQLGRYLAESALALGLEPRVVDPDPHCSASQVVPVRTQAVDDPGLGEALLDCDVVTYESENVPMEALLRLETQVPVHPRPAALRVTRDRLAEKRFLGGLGIPTADFRAVSSLGGLRRAVAELGVPSVLKTRFGGYDGKGQRVLACEADAEEAWRELGDAPLILEAFVPFDREISLIGARDRRGALELWSPVENVHRGGILRISRSPAPEVGPAALERGGAWLGRIGRSLGYAGVLTVEFFAVGERWIANEMACRVHNSGHWTLDGAATSQFENHLRAVAGLPLGSTRSRGASAMLNLIGGLPAGGLPARPAGRLYDYAKSPRPGRKVGHVNVQAPTRAEREARLRRLVEELGDPELALALGAPDPRRTRRRLRSRPSRPGRRSSGGSRAGGGAARCS